MTERERQQNDRTLVPQRCDESPPDRGCPYEMRIEPDRLKANWIYGVKPSADEAGAEPSEASPDAVVTAGDAPQNAGPEAASSVSDRSPCSKHGLSADNMALITSGLWINKGGSCPGRPVDLDPGRCLRRIRTRRREAQLRGHPHSPVLLIGERSQSAH